jgi:hypothetical protein
LHKTIGDVSAVYSALSLPIAFAAFGYNAAIAGFKMPSPFALAVFVKY